MASTYTLPLNSGSHAHSHGHSRSHNRALLPERAPAWTNGRTLKKPASSNSLRGHSHDLDDQLRIDSLSPYTNHYDHFHNHSQSVDSGFAFNPSMRGRPRGESDLGRPPQRPSNASNGYGFSPIQENPVVAPSSWLKLPEVLTAILIPLPYLLASLAYSTVPIPSNTPSTIAPSHNRLLHAVTEDSASIQLRSFSTDSPLIQACALSSTTLILVGILSKIRSSDQPLDRRKSSLGNLERLGKKQERFWSFASLRQIGGRILSILLPFYATMQLGGPRTAMILLTVVATGIGSFDIRPMKHTFLDNWKRIIRTRRTTCIVLLLGLLCDFLNFSANKRALILGHLTLATSVLAFPPPLPTTGWSLLTISRRASGPKSATSEAPWDAPASTRLSLPKPSSPLISSPEDTKLTLLAGLALNLLTIASAIVLSTSPPISYYTIMFFTLSVASATALLFFSLPSSLRTQRKPGVLIGYILITGFSYLQHPGVWKGFPYIGVLCVLCYAAATFDTTTSVSKQDARDHGHKHHGDHHLHGNHSKISGYLIRRVTSGSIAHSILIEKDSRRIAYFAMLNLTFMLVQFFYGFVSGSLGLLTDSIHMLFDCAGLAVGLAAAVMSKWPSNGRFPYGYGKVDTISGFANGIFLMLVSVEIVFDALERLWSGHELHRLNELLIVSILGFIVNIVGLIAFGHAHHGHDHGDHGHSHDYDSHSHGGHSHHHDNENMQGIFLHIMADTLGSLAVIISTLLTKYYGWSGWDPLASCIIAILIFLSAIPLVKSSGMRLLLSLPADVEYGIRNALQEISSLRGVVGYTVPRFWLEDAGAAHAEVHAHEHKHNHDHGHNHNHGDHCEHSHSHSPHYAREYDHSHSHGHGHGHEHSHDEHNHSPSHSYSHSDSRSHAHTHEPQPHTPAHQKVLGVIHIIAARTANLEDVRERTVQFLKGKGMDVVVHVEREGEGRCWCGGGSKIGG